MVKPIASFDFSSADGRMREAVHDGVFPGAVLLIIKQGEVLFHRAYGVANLSTNYPVKTDTVFDLASLTKPIVTTLSVMLLVQSGQLALGSTIGSLLPEFKHTPKEKITIRHLLSHTSGFPAHRNYYLEVAEKPPEARKDALIALLVAEPLAHGIGKTYEYSDLGFMVLRWIIEKMSGQRLDEFSRERIFLPLNIKDLFFIDLMAKQPQRDYAAAENCHWRNMLLQGQVSDENAYAMGGIDGHAGLFGTAAAVGAVMEELMATYTGRINKGLFQRKWLSTFFKRDSLSQRALGFDMPTGETPSSGRWFSKKSVGHLGFTGTSIWSDLDRDITIILLTNRVHPTRNNEKIKIFRPRIHNAVMTSLV